MAEEKQLPAVWPSAAAMGASRSRRPWTSGRTNVTLVEPRDAFVNNVAALRAAVDLRVAAQIFLPYDRLLSHGEVIRERAVRVDGSHVELAFGTLLEPDFLVLATGSTYPYPGGSDAWWAADTVEQGCPVARPWPVLGQVKSQTAG